jgi:hypothetical protein
VSSLLCVAGAVLVSGSLGPLGQPLQRVCDPSKISKVQWEGCPTFVTAKPLNEGQSWPSPDIGLRIDGCRYLGELT